MPTQANQNPDQPSSAIDLALIREWLQQAGEIALAHRFSHQTDIKADGTPVTTGDHEVETFLVDRIAEHYPQHRIITEEGGIYAGEQGFVWAIDPIDGTRAYASGLPVWGISAGVLQGIKPYAGAFFLPALGEMYWAGPDGAFFNGQPLPRLTTVDFESPLAFVAVPSNAHRTYHIDFPRTRSLGSVAAHLIYVARGIAVGSVTRQVKIWDIAGALPILRQTGGGLSYLSGQTFRLDELLAGELTPEPLIAAARSEDIDRVRAMFEPKSSV